MNIEIINRKNSSCFDLFIDKKYIRTFFDKEDLNKWKQKHLLKCYDK